LVFAKTADDRRRARYWRMSSVLRWAQLRRRTAAVDVLAAPAVDIPADQGFATLGPDAIDGVPAVVHEVKRLRAEMPLGEERPYLLDHRISRLDPSSPLLRFGLDDGVVASAARYLGMVPILTGVTVLVSPHVPGPISGSQLFHSDWEDVRQVKVFVACSDVGVESGPLVGVAANASERVKEAVGYRYGGPDFRIPDERVTPLVSDDEVTAFTGAVGSMTFIDTSSCLHMGSRVQPGAGERLVVQFQYLTPPAFDLVLRRRRPLADASAAKSTVERLVLG
jgi:hypothetical protein